MQPLDTLKRIRKRIQIEETFPNNHHRFPEIIYSRFMIVKLMHMQLGHVSSKYRFSLVLDYTNKFLLCKDLDRLLL